MPRSAATRRHLPSLHGGDEAACRRPQSRASTLGSIRETPSLGNEGASEIGSLRPPVAPTGSEVLWRFSGECQEFVEASMWFLRRETCPLQSAYLCAVTAVLVCPRQARLSSSEALPPLLLFPLCEERPPSANDAGAAVSRRLLSGEDRWSPLLSAEVRWYGN